MSLTIEKTIKAHATLVTLTESDKQNKFVFPSAVRMKFVGQLRKTRPVFNDYVAEHAALVRKWGKKDENADTISVLPANLEKYNEEHKALLESDSEVVLTPVKESDLGDNQIPLDLLEALFETGIVA